MVGISDCAQQNLKINPWFVTGFVDAEGCFQVSITENKELNLGWRVQSRFQISLHTKDRSVLEEIKNFLGAGEICRLGPNSLQFRIIDQKDLATVYYHFKKLQLITQKKADYELWCEVMDLIVPPPAPPHILKISVRGGGGDQRGPIGDPPRSGVNI